MSKLRWFFISFISLGLAFGHLSCNRTERAGPSIQSQSRPDGLFRIVENNKHGYIDKAGKIVIPPQFDDAGPFADGVATVAIGEKIGYVDKSGKYLWTPTK